MSQHTPGPEAVPPGGGPPHEHLPWVAALLSFLIPGIGQIYNQQTTKGAVFIAVYLIGWTVTYILMYVCVGFLLVPIMVGFWIVAIIDAAMIGQKIVNGQQIGEWEIF